MPGLQRHRLPAGY